MPGLIGRCRSASSRGRGAARIDHDELRAALAAVLLHALEQHRMAPRGVRADEHEQVGLIQILVQPRHGVGAERAAMARDRRRHAEPRIGVDIGRAEEALHQLVGDVIILGEQLAREIERDRIRPIALDDALEAVGDLVERRVPVGARECAILAQHRMQQPRREPERFAERGALRAQPPEIRRMLRIARDRRAACAVRRRQHAATDTAIRAGGANGRRAARGCSCGALRSGVGVEIRAIAGRAPRSLRG